MPPRFITFLTALLTPLVLVGFAIRLLLSPLFLQVEYRMPGFPPDEYGFTRADRLRWSNHIWTYLTNDSGVEYLEELRFDDGKPVFNERELSHMDDVKNVVKGSLYVFYGTLALLAITGLWSRRPAQMSAFLKGLRTGGWIIVGVAGVIATIVLIGMFLLPGVFWSFFSGFHTIFFTGDSWMFQYSDTLIRMFPLRFFQDVFLIGALLAVAGGLLLGLSIRKPS
jgi:integral membrane protein (TIGR01906 family)